MTDVNMTMTHTDTAAVSGTNFGGLADAVGGIATIVLAVVALAGIHPDVLLPVAVIVFGAALLVQGGTMLSEYAQVIFPSPGVGSIEQFRGGNLSAVFLVGIGGVVLGILALLGIAVETLTGVAIIAFGAALVLTANAVRELHVFRRATELSGSEMIAGEMASGSAGVQLLAGLTGVVLGILAISGANPAVLMLSALIVLGGAIVLSGSTLSGMVLSFMRPNGAHVRV
jgi:hypothetical protein